MKPQEEQTAALLGAELEATELIRLTGGTLPGYPHGLVTPADHTPIYDDTNVDDLLNEPRP